MDALVAQPGAVAEVCPACGGHLLIAPHDPAVPSYPTYSAVIPILERWCARCHLAWVGQAGTLVRTATALAQTRHEQRQLRQEREHLLRVAEAARELCVRSTFVDRDPASRTWQANGTDTLPQLEAAVAAWVDWARALGGAGDR